MFSVKNKFKKPVIALLAALVFLPLLVLANCAPSNWIRNIFSQTTPVYAAAVHSIQHYYYGRIKETGISSVTFYNGLSFAVTGSTVCEEPVYSGGTVKIRTISCSDFKKNDTVKIIADKTPDGSLTAAKIVYVPS